MRPCMLPFARLPVCSDIRLCVSLFSFSGSIVYLSVVHLLVRLSVFLSYLLCRYECVCLCICLSVFPTVCLCSFMCMSCKTWWRKVLQGRTLFLTGSFAWNRLTRLGRSLFTCTLLATSETSEIVILGIVWSDRRNVGQSDLLCTSKVSFYLCLFVYQLYNNQMTLSLHISENISRFKNYNICTNAMPTNYCHIYGYLMVVAIPRLCQARRRDALRNQWPAIILVLVDWLRRNSILSNYV